MAFLLCLTGLCNSENTTALPPITEFYVQDDVLYQNEDYHDTYNYAYDSSCNIIPLDQHLPDSIAKLMSNGAKLIKYDISFPDYAHEPFLHNGSFAYKPHLWQRVVGEHGKTLLSLAFNYDVLSLRMLTFGVEEVGVQFKDDPPSCFGALSESHQRAIIRKRLLSDFQTALDTDYSVDDNYICQQLIRDISGYADFYYDCCRFRETVNGSIYCPPDVEKDKWIDLLYILITMLKIIFLLLGPLILQKWIYHQSIRKADYTIRAPDVLRKTLVVRKIKGGDACDSNNVVSCKKDYPGQFIKFRQIVRGLPSNEVVPVDINQLHIQVDHKRLIGERAVPTGLLYFMWTNFFQCGLRRYEPFLSCCRESVIGSWETRFLWLKLNPDGSDCNRGLRKYCSYGHFIKLLGVVVLMAAVMVPYAIRVTVYYLYEEPEIQLRKEAIASLGLGEPIGVNLFHYLTPSHKLCLLLYVSYTLSFVVLTFYHALCEDVFEEIVLGSLQDLRSISRLECIRLFFSHLLLPLEKFGLCGGIVVGCIYWTLALPVCAITIIWYCVPTLYLTGRLSVQSRPDFIKYSAVPYVPKYKSSPTKNRWALESLSLGITSIESCMMLNNISPNTRDDVNPPDHKRICRGNCTKNIVGTGLTKVFQFHYSRV